MITKRYTIIYTVTKCIIFYIYKYVNVFLNTVLLLFFRHLSSLQNDPLNEKSEIYEIMKFLKDDVSKKIDLARFMSVILTNE